MKQKKEINWIYIINKKTVFETTVPKSTSIKKLTEMLPNNIIGGIWNKVINHPNEDKRLNDYVYILNGEIIMLAYNRNINEDLTEYIPKGIEGGKWKIKNKTVNHKKQKNAMRKMRNIK